MTFSPNLAYSVALGLLVGALAILFAPFPHSGSAEDRSDEMRRARAIVVAPGEAAFKEYGELGARFRFLSADALALDQTFDRPPEVLGLASIGAGSFAYVAEGTGSPVRLAIGQEAGGWRLTHIGPNFAEFSRGGDTKRVRLYQRSDMPRLPPEKTHSPQQPFSVTSPADMATEPPAD